MHIDANETQEGRDVKDTRLRRDLNVLDQFQTRERLMYTPGAYHSASESPRARAPEKKRKNENMKTQRERGEREGGEREGGLRERDETCDIHHGLGQVLDQQQEI